MSEPCCQCWVPAGTRYVPCGAPAIGQFRFGCLHEHVIVQWACENCQPENKRPACSACSAAGHLCLMNWGRVDSLAS